MANSGRHSGGRAAVRRGAGVRAARSAKRTPWGSSVGGRRPLDRRRQALLLHPLRRPLRVGTSEPHDSNPGCAALRDSCEPCKTSTLLVMPCILWCVWTCGVSYYNTSMQQQQAPAQRHRYAHPELIAHASCRAAFARIRRQTCTTSYVQLRGAISTETRRKACAYRALSDRRRPSWPLGSNCSAVEKLLLTQLKR